MRENAAAAAGTDFMNCRLVVIAYTSSRRRATNGVARPKTIVSLASGVDVRSPMTPATNPTSPMPPATPVTVTVTRTYVHGHPSLLDERVGFRKISFADCQRHGVCDVWNEGCGNGYHRTAHCSEEGSTTSDCLHRIVPLFFNGWELPNKRGMIYGAHAGLPAPK